VANIGGPKQPIPEGWEWNDPAIIVDRGNVETRPGMVSGNLNVPKMFNEEVWPTYYGPTWEKIRDHKQAWAKNLKDSMTARKPNDYIKGLLREGLGPKTLRQVRPQPYMDYDAPGARDQKVMFYDSRTVPQGKTTSNNPYTGGDPQGWFGWGEFLGGDYMAVGNEDYPRRPEGSLIADHPEYPDSNRYDKVDWSRAPVDTEVLGDRVGGTFSSDIDERMIAAGNTEEEIQAAFNRGERGEEYTGFLPIPDKSVLHEGYHSLWYHSLLDQGAFGALPGQEHYVPVPYDMQLGRSPGFTPNEGRYWAQYGMEGDVRAAEAVRALATMESKLFPRKGESTWNLIPGDVLNVRSRQAKDNVLKPEDWDRLFPRFIEFLEEGERDYEERQRKRTGAKGGPVFSTGSYSDSAGEKERAKGFEYGSGWTAERARAVLEGKGVDGSMYEYMKYRAPGLMETKPKGLPETMMA